jgi:hypothetical protein
MAAKELLQAATGLELPKAHYAQIAILTTSRSIMLIGIHGEDL